MRPTRAHDNLCCTCPCPERLLPFTAAVVSTSGIPWRLPLATRPRGNKEPVSATRAPLSTLVRRLWLAPLLCPRPMKCSPIIGGGEPKDDDNDGGGTEGYDSGGGGAGYGAGGWATRGADEGGVVIPVA